jgi:hypothetical protein
MTIVFRVGFEGESRQIELLSEGHYVVRSIEEAVIHLLDDEQPAPEPKTADTFERALALIAGWEQGEPILVEESVSDCLSAALVSTERRTSNAWQEWLRSGKLVAR